MVIAAAFQTVARSLLLPVLRTLSEQHPRLRVELDEMESEHALPLLRGGEIDLAIVEEYRRAPRAIDAAFERLDIATDHIVLALPEGHPAAQSGDPVRLRSLSGESWATTQPGTLFRDMFVQTCRSRGGFEPRVRHRANDIQLLLQLVVSGQALAMVPALGRPQTVPGVVVRPLAGGPLARSLLVIARQGVAQRPAVGAVVDALREQAEAIGLEPPA